MQHISQVITNQVVSQQEPTNSLTVYVPKSALTPDEQKVVQLKYRGKQIGKMDSLELSKWSKALLFKIHIITGWTVPAEEEFLNILIDQFEKKLLEDYSELNPDEIEYAFRSKGTVVEDWGKSMNLNLLDKVLIPYKNERYYISQMEEKVAAKPLELPPVPVSDEEFISSIFSLYLISKNYRQIPVLAYKVLEEKLQLSKEEKHRIYQHIHETTKEGDITELCKQWAVKEYFDKIIEEYQ